MAMLQEAQQKEWQRSLAHIDGDQRELITNKDDDK